MNAASHQVTGSKVVLTIAHLDYTSENCNPAILRSWCQRCDHTHDAGARIHTHDAGARIKGRQSRRAEAVVRGWRN